MSALYATNKSKNQTKFKYTADCYDRYTHARAHRHIFWSMKIYVCWMPIEKYHNMGSWDLAWEYKWLGCVGTRLKSKINIFTKRKSYRLQSRTITHTPCDDRTFWQYLELAGLRARYIYIYLHWHIMAIGGLMANQRQWHIQATICVKIYTCLRSSCAAFLQFNA